MQPIKHNLGIVWGYVLIWFLFEDLVVKRACYYVLSLFEVQKDIELAKTQARKALSTEVAGEQKGLRQSSFGESGSRVNSLIKSGELGVAGAPSTASAQPQSRLRFVETKVEKIEGALLRKRVLDKSDLA